MSPLMIY